MVRSTLILAVAAAALGASCFPPEAGVQESIDRLAVMDQRVQQQSSGATAAAAGAGRTANQTAGGTAGEVQGAQAAIEDEAERPFTVSVDLPVSYTNNAFQSEDDEEEDDFFFAPALSLGYQLSLEGLGDPSGVISFGASISTERYADSSDLDTDFVAGSVQYVHAFGAFLTSLSYSPSERTNRTSMMPRSRSIPSRRVSAVPSSWARTSRSSRPA